ncbi:Crp/Fnr family transcriptional regulator [Aeromicrobium sp.]|nr:Crp/Fnr family transcriptional regulator [Candidatus Saccharibacteria bacterium]
MYVKQHNDDTENIISHFSGGKTKRFSKGEVLVQGDEEPKGVYLIQSGYVRAYTIARTGQHNLLLIHGSNEIMPLPWALDGVQKLGVFYEAMNDVTIINSSKDDLRLAMGSDIWLTEQILQQLVSIFTVYAQRIQSLEYRLPRERVIARLLDLADRFGHATAEGIVIEAPVTHQDIADSINMTRETASRALELLFYDELVVQNQHLFVILDAERLLQELS